MKKAWKYVLGLDKVVSGAWRIYNRSCANPDGQNPTWDIYCYHHEYGVVVIVRRVIGECRGSCRRLCIRGLLSGGDA